jgi:hypothetical protein
MFLFNLESDHNFPLEIKLKMTLRTTFTFRPLQAFYAIGIVAVVITVTRIDFKVGGLLER